MHRRRLLSRKLRISVSGGTQPKRRATGMIRWFDIIVDSAMQATMTIDVADEKPPRKASSAIVSWLAHIGRVRTNMSGLEPSGSMLSPPMAIGSTNSISRNRYSGNIQDAVRRCRSSEISTTVTWNCRGRQMMAVADSSVTVTQRAPNTSSACRISGDASSNSSPGLPARKKTSRMPTASRANSLTTASRAIAATTPW